MSARNYLNWLLNDFTVDGTHQFYLVDIKFSQLLSPKFEYFFHYNPINSLSFIVLILTAASITIAAKHFISLWSNTDAAIGLVIAYLVFIGVIIILQEILTICEMISNRNDPRVDVLEMQTPGKGPGSPLSPTTVAIVTNSKVNFFIQFVEISCSVSRSFCSVFLNSWTGAQRLICVE